MEYVFYFIIAIVISLIISVVTIYTESTKLNVIEYSVSWTLIPYGLILAFSIGIFFNRYDSFKKVFTEEANNLEIIYNLFIVMDPSEDKDNVINSIIILS